MEKLLQDLGLTETESKIYLCLLKKGSSQTGVIAKDTGIHRRTIYDSIERLIEKGLVSYISHNNTKFFEAIDPERLLNILKEKQDKINLILPELKNLHKNTREKKETLFFRGKESIKSVFDDQINVGNEILFIGKGMNVNEIIKFYFPKFDAKRIEKNIPIKMLFDNLARDIESIKKIQLADIKYIPASYSSPMSLYIYGNNVSIVLWSNDPTAVLIRQKEVAEGFREHFNILWQIGKH